MAEGVEFLLELQAKLAEASQMVRELGKVEHAAKQTDHALKQAEEHTGLFGKVLEHTKEEAGEFARETAATFTALAGAKGLEVIIDKLSELGHEAIEVAAETERTTRSFQLLMGVEPANEMLEFLDRLARTTEFTDGTIKGFAAQLIKAGFAGEAFDRAMAATIDLAALSQNKFEGAAEAINLLSRIQLKGGISQRELVGAGLSSKSFFTRLSKDLGIGIDEVEKRVQEGKVKTGVLIEALYSEIAAKTQKPLGGAGVALSTTFAAQLEKTKDLLPNLFEELGKPGRLDGLTKSLTKLNAAVSPDSALGKAIVGGLEHMLDKFGRLVTTVDFDKWAERLSVAMGIFETVVDVGAELGKELGEIFDFLTGFGDALGDVLADITGYVKRFFSGAVDLGKAVWEGLQEGIVSGITYVVDAVEGLGNAAVAKLKSVLGIHSPSAVFADFGAMTAAGFEVGIERSLPGVTSTVADAFSAATLMPALGPVPIEPIGPLLAGPAPAPAVSAGGGGGNTINAHVTVNVQAGGAGATDAQEIGDKVGAGIREALESLLAQMAAEGAAG